MQSIYRRNVVAACSLALAIFVTTPAIALADDGATNAIVDTPAVSVILDNQNDSQIPAAVSETGLATEELDSSAETPSVAEDETPAGNQEATSNQVDSDVPEKGAEDEVVDEQAPTNGGAESSSDSVIETVEEGVDETAVESTSPEVDTKDAVSETGSDNAETAAQEQAAKDTTAVVQTAKKAASPSETVALKAQADDDVIEEDEKRNVKDGTYMFGVALNKNMVLDVADNSSKAGANVQLYSASGSVAQKWTVKYIADGIYNIFKYGTQMVLSVAGNKTANGTNVELAKLAGTNGSKGQQWRFIEQGNGYYSLVSALRSTLAVDVQRAKAVNKQNIQVYRKNNSNAQKFKLYEAKTAEKSTVEVDNGTYTIRSTNSPSLGLDIKGASKAHAANVQLYKGNGSQAQKFHFESDGNGYYVVTVIGSGKVLSVKNASVIPGNNVMQTNYSGSNTQKWAVHEAADGIVLVNKATGLAVDIAGAKYANGTNIQAYKRNNSAAQIFKLDSVATLKDGIYSITSLKAAGRYVEIKGNSKANGAAVQINSSTNDLGQRFELINVSKDGKELYRIRTASSGGFLSYVGGKLTQYGNHATGENDANTWELVWNGAYFSLRNVAQNKVLELKGGKTTTGTAVQVYRANKTVAQHFYFNPANLVGNGAFIFASKVDTKGNLVLSSSGSNIQIASKSGGDVQRFVLKATGSTSNVYTITTSGKLIGVASTGNGANVSLGGKYKQWVAAIGDGGYVTFINKATGKTLAVKGGTAKAGTNVWQYSPTGNPAQQWKLTRAVGWDLSSGKYVFYDNSGKKSTFDQYCYKAWNRIKNMSSGTKYIAAVDLTNCYTNIFVKQGSIWAPLNSWVCSVGNRSAGAGTPVGTFTVNGVKTRLTLIEKEEVNYKWGVHYWTVFYPRNQWGGGTGFHSYIYMNASNYLLDGREQMHITGSCVRLSKPRAQWIYEHLNKGTRVHTYY